MTAREGRNKTRHVCEKMKEGVAKNTYLRGRWRGGERRMGERTGQQKSYHFLKRAVDSQERWRRPVEGDAMQQRGRQDGGREAERGRE